MSSPLFYDGGGVGIPYRLGSSASAVVAAGGQNSIAPVAPSVAGQSPAGAGSEAAVGSEAAAGAQAPSARRPVTGTTTAAASAQALIFHLQGKSGTRVEVLKVGG